MIEMLPPPLIPTGYNGSVIWVRTIPHVEDEAIDNICNLLLFKDLGQHQGERNPSIAILHNKKKSKTLAKKLIQKNSNWSGPHEDANYNGSEADAIVYICDGSMNIQTLARARRLLIILTCDTECNPATILMLQEAVSQNMTEIVSSGSYLAEMTKCNVCETMYNYVQNDQCPNHIICPKFADGCLWKGPPGFQKTHMENCEYCGDTKIDISQQDETSKNSGYLTFYSNLVAALKKCSISIVLSVVMVMLLLLSLILALVLGGPIGFGLLLFSFSFIGCICICCWWCGQPFSSGRGMDFI